jgi:hypothetical protein
MAALHLQNHGGDADPPSPEQGKPTICAECVYFYNMTPSLNAMPLAVCTNPLFARPSKVDFVTGQQLNETRPRCETINHGHCPGFVRDRSRYLLFAVGLVVIASLLAMFFITPR